ncbi:hypothetical protein ABZT04_28310 [Streptomyces sp. NPDC005492]
MPVVRRLFAAPVVPPADPSCSVSVLRDAVAGLGPDGLVAPHGAACATR